MKNDMEEEYKQSKMVNWFEPAMLFQTAIKAIISSLFGNYADRREMEAALDIETRDDNVLQLKDLVYDYSTKSDDLAENNIWVDFVSDTGDGFNSTYSVALTVAAEKLLVNIDNEQKELPRSKILVMGGDQIYPTPTGEMYDNKFRIPFKAAFPEKENDNDRPHMYAIPGNHDWYDGLGNFLKVFCQKRWIGNWETRQRRSYFALKLPHRYWIWATDIQLNEDIDEPQKQYFIKVGMQMQQDDKVILCTAEPAWVYKELYVNDKSYDRLKFFIETYITDDKASCMHKTFKLAAVLTGDLHHYSHYCSAEEGKPIHYIGAGGGGAFLHLTHNLPHRLKNVEMDNIKQNEMHGKGSTTGQLREGNILLRKAFPSREKSRELLRGNFAFVYKNRFFGFMVGTFYCLVYWLIQSKTAVASKPYLYSIDKAGIYEFLIKTGRALAYTPSAIILCLLIIFGLYKFADTKNGKRGIGLFAAIHGILQCLLIFLVLWAISSLQNFGPPPHRWYHQVLIMIELLVAGSVIGGCFMGLYLYFSNILFSNHIDESSSSLINEDFKNFLRMNIDDRGLTIYPIGIEKVTKKWETGGTIKNPSFKGEEPAYHLIEEPIFIAH